MRVWVGWLGWVVHDRYGMGWDGRKDGWMHGAARRGEGTSAHRSRVGLRGVLSLRFALCGVEVVCMFLGFSFLALIAFFWAACRDTLLTFFLSWFGLFFFPSANGGSKSTLLYVHPAATGWRVCLSVYLYVRMRNDRRNTKVGKIPRAVPRFANYLTLALLAYLNAYIYLPSVRVG